MLLSAALHFPFIELNIVTYNVNKTLYTTVLYNFITFSEGCIFFDQEKMRGHRGALKALARMCQSH